jgi:hypothetical protein
MNKPNSLLPGNACPPKRVYENDPVEMHCTEMLFCSPVDSTRKTSSSASIVASLMSLTSTMYVLLAVLTRIRPEPTGAIT